jgi:predicted esterase
MMRIFFVSGLAALLLLPFSVAAQVAKLKVYPPDAATMEAIQRKITELKAATEQLRKLSGFRSARVGSTDVGFCRDPMVDVFLKAAEFTVRHNEFWQKGSDKQTLDVIEEGLRRAKDFSAFERSLRSVAGRTLACGYRSIIDNSSQPFVASFPVNFDKHPDKKWRLDIVLHGRDNTLTEVKMLAGALKRGPVKPDQDYIQLEVYGRGNNAYRWAGETDVLEAWRALEDLTHYLSDAARESRIDRNRIVLRGFSMGGAGTWHIGLHKPDQWCVIGPGAGFTTTHGYIKNLPAKLPDYQEDCLRIYDAVDYAENAAMIPVVAYAGDKDAQQQAAINIENILKPLGIPMTRLTGTGLTHQFPPEWQKKAQEAYAPFVQRGRNVNAKKIHFVTYTLSYPSCDWIQIKSLDQHFLKTTVDAVANEAGFTLQTKNVRSLDVSVRPAQEKLPKLLIKIDGQDLLIETPLVGPNGEHTVSLTRPAGKWIEGKEPGTFRKTAAVHGPIDDAFRRKFLCIQGTGQCWHPEVQAYTDAALARFRREWERYFRAKLPVMTDTEFLRKLYTGNWKDLPELTGHTLVFFGDPASNAALAKLMRVSKRELPFQWDSKIINFGGKTYASDKHVPVCICPNPLHPESYLVINSGHTFHEADIQGTNALLYPRLGDFAILKPTPTAKDSAAAEVVRAGLFDDDWKVPLEK